MWSKAEASKIRKEFWTAFGLYMQPVVSAEMEKINWINYRTGEKHVSVTMDADKTGAGIGIRIDHPDEGLRALYFEQLVAFRNRFEELAGTDWNWELHHTDPNERTSARIFKNLSGASIFMREDWPAIISFFKQNMIAIDAFWSEVKYAFEALR